MQIDVAPATLDEIQSLRDLHLKEVSCQIILHSWPERGWSDSYLLRLNDRVVGYGCVGGVRAERKEIITEFYVLPVHRAMALPLFRRLAAVSQAKSVETQTNDLLLTLMLFDCSAQIESHAVLFHDALTTCLQVPGATFRRVAEADRKRISPDAKVSDVEWMIEVGGEVAATGGILFHYNPPYGDIYMQVAEPFRRRGYGSYLVQELKRTCYEMGKVPAARSNASNAPSRATLEKAGMLPCARVLTGAISA